MAEINDSRGRVTEINSAEFEKLSASLLSATKIVIDNVSKMAKDQSLNSEIVKALGDLGENVSNNVEALRNLVAQIKEVGDELEKQKSASSEASKGDRQSLRETNSILQKILASHEKARQEVSERILLGAGAATAAIGADSRAERAAAAALRHGSGGGRNGGGPPINPSSPGDPGDAARYRKHGEDLAAYINQGFNDNFKVRMAKLAMGVSSMMLGGHGSLIQSIFAGSVADATEFGQEMKEIAFQTQGVTGEFRNMQNEFANLGGSVVSETGKTVDALQKAVTTNFKKGFKNQKDGLKVLKSGLFLSTMIGSETQQTAELFGDWHRTLGMSANQMSDLARSMRDVALSTGVTGDELLGAMKSSEGILKNMRNQGILTSSAARSTIQMVAEFKKTGFEENTKFVEAMSSYAGMMNADQRTQALLFSVAAQAGGDASERMIFGNFGKTRKDQSVFASSLKDMVAEAIGRGPGQGKNLDFKNLSEEERQILSVFSESLGTSIAGLESLASTYEKSSRGLDATLEELDKKASSKFGTEEEKKQALQQKNQAIMGAGQNALASLREKSAEDINLKDAMKQIYESRDFSNSKDDMSSAMINLASNSAEMAKKFGLSGTKEQMAAQVAGMGEQKFFENSMVASVEALMKGQKEQGLDVGDYSAMLKALKTGDTKTFNEMYDKFDKDQKILATKTEAALDPAKALANSMAEFNEKVRNFVSKFVSSSMALIGSMGLLALQIGLNSAALWATLGSPVRGIGSWLAGLGGMGGTAAGAAGVGGAGGKRFNPRDIFGSLDETGDRWKNNIVGSLEDVGERGSKFFNKVGNAFENASRSFKESRKGIDAYFFKLKPKGIFESLLNSGDAFLDTFSKSKTKPLTKLLDSFKNTRPYKTTASALDHVKKAFKESSKAFALARRGNAGLGFKVPPKNILKSSFQSVDKFFDVFTGGRVAKGFNFITNSFKNVWKGLKIDLVGGPNPFDLISRAWKSKGGFSGLTKVFSGGFGGFFRNIGGIFKGGMMATAKGARAAILGGTAGTAQLVFTAIDAVFGAVSGFQNTGKNFEGLMKAMGKETQDMTWGMYAASTTSGALVGILDGLTFGLLRFSGAAEWLEKFLSLTLYGAFTIFEGVLQGFYDVLKPVGRAFLYIGEQFKGIGESFLKVFNSIASIFGAEAADLSGAFALIIPWLKPIGRAIGWIVGAPIGAALWVVVKAISAVIGVVEILANVFAAAVKWVTSFVKAIGSIFTGDWSALGKNLTDMGGAMLDAVTGIFKPIVNWIWSIAADIISPFKWLGDILIWNSIIPDMCYGIAGFFAGMAKTVLLGLGKFVFNVARFFLKLPFKIMKGLFNTFVRSPIKLMGRFIKGAAKVWQNLSPYVDEFFSLFKKNLYDYVGIAIRAWKGLLDYISGGWFSKILGWLKGFGKWIDDYIWQPLKDLGGKVLKWADEYILTPLKNLGSRVAKLADDWLVKPFASAMQSISQKFSDYLFKPVTNFLQKIGLIGKETAKSAGKAATAAANPVASAADDAAKAAGKAAAQKGGWFRKIFGNADDVAKTNPFGKMGGSMGKAARATSKAAVVDDAAKVVLSSADDIAKAAPKALGFLGKASKFVGVAAKKLPVVGPLIDFGIRKMTGESTSKAAVGAAGGMAGGLAGAAAGAAIGSIIPVIGTGVGAFVGGIVGSLGGGWIADTIYDNVGGAFSTIGSGLKSTFVDFPMWVGGKVKDGFNSVGSWIGEKAYGVYESAGGAVDWALKKSEQLGNYMGKMLDPAAWGTWLGGLQEGLNGIWGWMKGWIPGLGAAAEGFSQTAAEQARSMETNGPSTAHAVGSVYGAGANLLQGNVWEAGSKAGMAIQETGMAAVENAKIVGAAIQKGFSSAWGGLKSMFGYGDSLDKQVEQGKAMEKTMEMGQNPGSIYVHDTHTEKALNDLMGKLMPAATSGSGLENLLKKTQVGLEDRAVALTTPVGHHAIPMVRPESESEVGAVQPVHLRDITESILREKTSAQAGTNKLQSDELARIEEASKEQVDELVQIKEAINSLVDLMKPRSSILPGGGANSQGNTRDPRSPVHAAIFGNSRYGRVGDSANRSLVNNGK
jgi:hypothetical protein